MKKLLYIGLAAAAGLAFFACSKDTVKGTDTPEESTGKLVTITASIPEEGLATKVSFAEDETTLRLTKIAWEAGDVLDIAGKTFTIVDASISTDGKTASFTGVEPAAASSYTVTYNSIASKGIDLNAQEQTSNGSTDHLGYSIVVEATDYKTVSFESATSQSSVLQLRAKLPTAIKDAVKKVIFKSNLAVFNGEKQLTVALGDGTTGSDNLLNVYATLPTGAQTLSEKMELLIQFQVVADKEYEKYTAYREFPANTAFIKEGAAQYIGIDCSNIESYANKTNTQIGSADNPYLIGDQHQMDAIHDELIEDSKVFFKVIDDVDLTGIDWVPLNNTGEFSQKIDFDGGNKTITNLTVTSNKTYPGFFGVLNGTAKNIVFDKAKITTGNSKAGVFAGYLGSNGYTDPAIVSNVIVQNSSVSGATTDGYCGGFAGSLNIANSQLTDIKVIKTEVKTAAAATRPHAGGFIGVIERSATFTRISVQGVTINVGYPNGTRDLYVGGLSAYVAGAVSFNDCSVGKAEDGTISSIKAPAYTTGKSIMIGGLAGYLNNANAKFDNCVAESVKIELSGTASDNNYRYVGGAFGYINNGKIGETEGCKVLDPSFVNGKNYLGGFVSYLNDGSISNCTVSGANTISGNATVGGFVAYAVKGVLNKNTTSLKVSGSTNIGGFAGQLVGAVTVEKCSSKGETVNASGNVCGGFVAIANNGASIFDSYSTSNLTGSSRKRGGLVGYINAGTVTIERCYATGSISANFELGGLVGFVEVEGLTMKNSAAWNSSITASNRAASNWSSASVVGVAYPTCTLTNNYRKPDIQLTAYWGTTSDCTLSLSSSFQHPDVSSSTPLTDPDGNTVTSSTMRPYHGKVEAGKTLSQLASTTLGWDSTIWDLDSGDFPTLIGVN